VCALTLLQAGSVLTGGRRDADTANRAPHDQAVWQRLKRCPLLLAALGKQMLPLAELPPVPRRWLSCNGTTLQQPGATSADSRRHLVSNLFYRSLHAVQISTSKKGESRQHSPLPPGDVVGGIKGMVRRRAVWMVSRSRGRIALSAGITDCHCMIRPPKAERWISAKRSGDTSPRVRFPGLLQYAEGQKNQAQRELGG
jgi:hypothetical protein